MFDVDGLFEAEDLLWDMPQGIVDTGTFGEFCTCCNNMAESDVFWGFSYQGWREARDVASRFGWVGDGNQGDLCRWVGHLVVPGSDVCDRCWDTLD